MNTDIHAENTEPDLNEQVEIDQTDLGLIAAALPVRSGLHAGRDRTIQPCL
jgi:hypothetical protein